MTSAYIPVNALYFPVGKTVQCLTLVSRLLYAPTGHAKQDRDAGSQHFLVLHAVQSDAFMLQSAAFMPPAPSLHS